MALIMIPIMAILGLLLGNLMTSFYYRIPHDVPLYGQKCSPHCAKCQHKLSAFEYLPVIGWINCMGKCKKCSAPIDKNYYLIEIISMLTLPYIYFFATNSDEFILLTFIIFSLILNVFIFISYNIISNKIIFFVSFLSFTLRCMQDSTIFPVLYSALLLMIILAILERYNTDNSFSNLYKLLIIIFITPVINHWIIFILFFLLLSFFRFLFTVFSKKEFNILLIIHINIILTLLISHISSS